MHLDRSGKSSLDAIDQIIICVCSLVTAQALRHHGHESIWQFAADERRDLCKAGWQAVYPVGAHS